MTNKTQQKVEQLSKKFIENDICDSEDAANRMAYSILSSEIYEERMNKIIQIVVEVCDYDQATAETKVNDYFSKLSPIRG